MKKLLILIAMFAAPFIMAGQTSSVYIKLTDAGGKQIKGTSTMRGFENCIIAQTLATAGKNNSQVNFTMEVSGASGELKRLLGTGEYLTNGMLTVISISGGRAITQYKINMEKMRVTACSESMGCNNVMTTTVVLQAMRIGWTYYQQDRTGNSTVSSKFGYDLESGKSWEGF